MGDVIDIINRATRVEGVAREYSLRTWDASENADTLGSDIDVTELGRQAVFYLAVSYLDAGATLTVTVQEKDPSGNYWDLFAFAQKTTKASERKVFGDSSGNFIGKTIRYSSDVSGNVNYRVDVVGRL